MGKEELMEKGKRGEENGGQRFQFQQRGSPGVQSPHPRDTKDEDNWTLVSVSYYFPGFILFWSVLCQHQVGNRG